jgi:hypothetical protein
VSSTKVDTSDTDLTEEHSIVHHQPKVFVKNSRSSELEGVLNACSCQLRFDINYTGSILPQIGSDDYYFYEGGRLNIRCKGEIIVEHTIPKIGQFDVLNKDQIKGQLEDWVIEKSGEVLSEIDETKWCND